MPDYKGVIFDMDGTILDSMELWSEIDVLFLSKRGFAVPDDYMQSIAHMRAYETAEYTIKRFNLNDTPEELIDEWISVAVQKYKTIPEKPGVLKYFKYLKKHNIKIALATATELPIVKAALEDREIYTMIDSITTLSEVKRGKGYPDIYLKSCEKLKLDIKECIVFEDILVGVKAAKNGGFKTYAMYDKRSENLKDEIKKISDGFIYNFEEMIEK